ncbi:MAG: hypothetical protein ACFFD7_14445 [Candidatus Thorarchaeota archaeon]
MEEKIPWIPLLTNIPTPIEQFYELEKKFNLNQGEIYIKRDDQIHEIYDGNILEVN